MKVVSLDVIPENLLESFVFRHLFDTIPKGDPWVSTLESVKNPSYILVYLISYFT